MKKCRYADAQQNAPMNVCRLKLEKQIRQHIRHGEYQRMIGKRGGQIQPQQRQGGACHATAGAGNAEKMLEYAADSQAAKYPKDHSKVQEQ